MTLEEAERLIRLEDAINRAISNEEMRETLSDMLSEDEITRAQYKAIYPESVKLSISEEMDFNELMNTAKETIRLYKKEKKSNENGN